MRTRIVCGIAATAILLLCLTGFQQASAKLVRDGKAAASNPAVEAGGHHLPSQPDPAIPYSMIGAVASEGHWIMQCALWPWRQFGTLAWFRHHGNPVERFGGLNGGRFGERHGERHPPFVPVP